MPDAPLFTRATKPPASSARAPRNQASVVSMLANTAMSGIDAANKDENPAVEVMGLLPPHEQMLDIATYGPVLIAKESASATMPVKWLSLMTRR